MKKLIAIFILIYTAVAAQHALSQNGIIDTNKVLVPESYHPRVNQVVTSILTNYHYLKTDLNDSLSAIIFDNYINTLDHSKLYFLKSDIEEFRKERFMIDDYLQIGNVQFAYKVFNRYKERLNSRIKSINNLLKKEFDYTVDEYYEPDRDSSDWSVKMSELDEIWRKRIKNDALNKKLSGDDWQKTAESLSKRYSNFHTVILQYKSEDVFQLYMNAFATAIDPHTSYFSPITSENFNISMARSLEGIGAQLTSIDGYTTIVKVIKGGPADKSNNLFENDRIVAVGQGEDGEMVDVVGWRTDDVVQLIRGDKGTTVRLEILRAEDTPDMPTTTIKLVREKVTLEDQSVSTETILLNENNNSFNLGVIKIPAFYLDFKARARGDRDYKSTTRDVKKAIVELQKQNVDGIIVDLRGNGGGSLQEAIELTGLFIEDGPVVQVKDTRGIIEVNKDPDPSIFYSGPMAVLIDRYSASASEIFSAAIQDYGRGLIIGEQTFGKGTVQNLIDLNRMLRSGDTEFGNVKLTIAKYYRINGSSTQLKGVLPDIPYPTVTDPGEVGEASYPSAMKWDQISTSYYDRYDNFSDYLPEILERHNNRIDKDIEFQYMLEDIREYKINKEKKRFSLRESVRKVEREEAELKRKTREEERQKRSELKVVKKNEVNAGESDLGDPELEESGRILADLITLKFG
ncbi:MAG: carboxy terminal-processing peptidase [Melioribacteraceae bacterium]|nr:carboxy terminal-processing peptidase [Melioribacteraceae bacterium]